jgi:YHS domain-containing protein
MADGTPRKFYAAGDKNQNAPIYASCLNRLEMKAYYSRAVAMLFPNHLTLKVCKRVPVHQRERMNAIRDAVLNTDEDLLSISKRFFKPITKLHQVTGYAVCSTNAEARAVNEFRQQKVAEALEKQGEEVLRIDGRIYYFSQTLRCRKFHKKPRIYINYTYTVTGFELKDGAVTGIKLEETGEWPWAPTLVKQHFLYDHANTCHSLQGMTADGGVTLFDLDLWCASSNREWFYTALTRTKDLDAVLFWDPAAGSVSNSPTVLRSDFRQAMEGKLRGYKSQDTAKGRLWLPETYVDGDDIMSMYDEQGGRCAHCSAWLPPTWKEKDRSQPTLDRLDNSLAHVKGNCCLCCLSCNSARH